MEVLEKIVIEAVIVLHTRNRVHHVPRADIVSLVTVASVRSDWREIIFHRTFNRRQIRRLFTKKVHTYSFM